MSEPNKKPSPDTTFEPVTGARLSWDAMTDTAAQPAQYDHAETDSLLRTSNEYQQRHFYKLAVQLAACDAELKQCEEENQEMRGNIYAWLGFYRDHIKPEAVTKLQDILGPLAALERKET